jgi:hypothetical protein
MNPNQKWSYLEPDDVCSACDALWAVGCGCPNGQKVSGGPGKVITVTEQEIIDQYYPYWEAQIARVGKSDLATYDNCIEDWVAENWAVKVK